MRGHRHDYIPAFDGLRAIAILPVVLLHVGVNTLTDGNLLYQLTRGWYGVDLFFVLSGFLITRFLLAEMDKTVNIDITGFYGRGFLCLNPPYMSMLKGQLSGTVVLEPST